MKNKYSLDEIKELKDYFIGNAAPIPVKKTPGKVFSKLVSVDLVNKIDQTDTTVKVKSARVKKSSSQLDEDSWNTLKYKIPFVDPEAVKLFYCQSPTFFRCVKFKSACVLGLGWDIVPDSKMKNYKTEAEYIRFNKILTEPINDLGETFQDILVGYGDDYYAFGNSYLEVIPVSEKAVKLYNLRAYNTRIHYDARFANMGDGITFLQLIAAKEAVRYKLLNRREDSKDHEVLWIKNYNPFNRFYGFPESYPATADLALERSAKEYNIKGFKNDLMISFMIVVEGGELDDTAMEAVQNFLEKNYKGLENANKALYLNSDTPDVKIRIEKLNRDIREGSFDKLMSNSQNNVIMANGLLGILMGLKTPGQLGGSSEIKTLFNLLSETIIKPDKIKFQSKLNDMLRSKLNLTKFHIELKELTYETLTEQIQYVQGLVPTGVIDQNEGRQYLGYEPREEDSETDDQKLEKAYKIIKAVKQKLAA